MAMSEAQKKARWADFVQWYQTNVAAAPGGPQGTKIPEALKKLYMANDGAWSKERAMQWIRLNDPNYMRTKMATSRMDALKSLYEKAFGYKVNWRDPKMKQFLESFARGNPNININRKLTEIFMKRILPSDAFKKANPGFWSWLNRNRQMYGSADIVAALDDYNQAKENLSDEWAKYLTTPIPKSVLDEAIKNDWAPDSMAFKQALYGSDEWKTGAGYQERSTEFDDQWEAIFGKGVEADEALRDRYARDMSGKSFGEFFHSVIKKSQSFKDMFPDYGAWETAQHKAGKPEGTVDVFTYFERRQELVDIWYENYTDGQPPDPDIITEAMRGNWGNALFQNKIRMLPQYATTGAGKDRAARFDTYWRGLFGDISTPDPVLRSRFISSEVNDPSAYWEDIKNTEAFRTQFKNWDIFAAAQQAAGINVVEDPLAYNEYQAAFRRAFEDNGIDLPEGMDRAIFASGVGAEDLSARAQLWQETKEAYTLQTGKEPELTSVLGVGNRQAGSDMRTRLQKALERQRVWSRSRNLSVETQQKTGLITQKI